MIAVRLTLAGMRARALAVLVVLLSAHAGADELTDKRQQYLRALRSLDSGQIEAFHAAKAQLVDYPLFPYLDYQDHLLRLNHLTAVDVAAFRERWNDSPIADRLYNEWMDDLARRGAWDVFMDNYEADGASADRQCTYLRALDRNGQTDAAMAAVAPLWLVGTSQPRSCDALFARWIEQGQVNNRLVWERLTLAIQTRSWDLARYLAGLLSVELRKQGDLFYRVGRDPSLVTDTARFTADDTATREIVRLGIRRLASNDPDAAATAWAVYRKTLSFEPDDVRIINQDLTIAKARRGTIDPDADLSPSADGRDLLVQEALILAALTNKDWPNVEAFIMRLNETERAKQRWQYWLGRAQQALAGARDNTAPPTESPWIALANDRQYYGFLAAEALGQRPALNDSSTRPEPDAINAMLQRPPMQRLMELYAIGDRANARREWAKLLQSLDLSQRAASAYIIADIGWLDLSILAANAAELRDDLSLRFPSPYTQTFAKESRATAVPISYLYGVARQESAFAPAARSSAGALGLMQLMPATAAATARNAGEPTPVTNTLFNPVVNIHIASRHLADLLERYDGNRVLVAAAYNAGPHRVDRWLRDRPARPADIWIETIPFAETRDYVKNVLAFAYIYGQRLGHPTKFLDADER